MAMGCSLNKASPHPPFLPCHCKFQRFFLLILINKTLPNKQIIIINQTNNQMKIQCDVCDKDEASVFCVADEAALCAACDHRVHHANKLAGKHQRFSLLHPSPKQAPLCDICQEKRAFLFCQQDRAILCKDCDFQIHKANEHTKNHTRFFLTGVKLSSTAELYSDSKSTDSDPAIKPQDSKFKPVFVSQTNSTPPTSKGTTVQTKGAAAPVPCDNLMNSSIPTSSISEYLMETPGWGVEDFLDASSYGFSKSSGNIDVMPFWDGDLESKVNGFPNGKTTGLWVPQVVAPPLNQSQNQLYELAFGAQNGTKGQFCNNSDDSGSGKRWWSEDSCFVVPQISPSLSASKRFKTSF
ncbi:hypothetical protein CASFOL_015909 [Castilleja foliolosa]|uniref:B box-type domain-containing protein n=1 Tax=Castilleja foliolosa TaxID=1961234 RepID=A0ABD3DF28_9LAMI